MSLLSRGGWGLGLGHCRGGWGRCGCWGALISGKQGLGLAWPGPAAHPFARPPCPALVLDSQPRHNPNQLGLPRCLSPCSVMPDMPNGFNELDKSQAVAIDYRSMPGGPYTRYSGGRTLTHEVGHFLGLLHTFGEGSCEASGGSDGIFGEPGSAKKGESGSFCEAHGRHRGTGGLPDEPQGALLSWLSHPANCASLPVRRHPSAKHILQRLPHRQRLLPRPARCACWQQLGPRSLAADAAVGMAAACAIAWPRGL